MTEKDNRPDCLRRIGFRSCDHPLTECRAYPGVPTVLKSCLTCGAAITTRGGTVKSDWYDSDTMAPIKYYELERYGLLDSFAFWIAQRPTSRTFGDVT
jgi:hypothetical protein